MRKIDFVLKTCFVLVLGVVLGLAYRTASNGLEVLIASTELSELSTVKAIQATIFYCSDGSAVSDNGSKACADGKPKVEWEVSLLVKRANERNLIEIKENGKGQYTLRDDGVVTVQDANFNHNESARRFWLALGRQLENICTQQLNNTFHYR